MNFSATTTLLACLAVSGTQLALQDTSSGAAEETRAAMELGNFSMSLDVEDLKVSRAFYEKLGFEKVQGDEKMNYLILQNSTATIGLFQGMFENNILTFNPGWDRKGDALEEFTDIRELQKRIKEAGITPVSEADPESKGPANFILVDPDGNTIYLDQHVPAPKR